MLLLVQLPQSWQGKVAAKKEGGLGGVQEGGIGTGAFRDM